MADSAPVVGDRDPTANPIVASSRRRWLDEPLSTHALDLALLASAVTPIITKSVVMWFHVIFALLAVAALVLPYRQFVVRLVVWMSVSTGLVVWGVTSLDLQSDELQELPLLLFVLVLVFHVAQQRARAADEREAAYQALNARMDLELDDLHHQLEQSQRLDLLGRTSAGLAHDLRNLFVVIRGCSGDVAGQSKDELEACLEEVHGASERAMAMIDELLQLGREPDPRTATIELREALHQMRPLLRRLTASGTVLEIDVPARLDVRIDRVSLSQVLMNLVANADDAIEGTGRIVVGAHLVRSGRPGEASTEYATISVADDGAGFDRSAIGSAFEPGFTTKPDHNGLGLATVWRIVDRLGGTVDIQSSEAGGTRVSVRIPLATEPAAAPAESANPAARRLVGLPSYAALTAKRA